MTAIVLDNPKLEQDIPIDRIHPDPFQPRLEPDAELGESIRSQGILQAISVELIESTNSAERICPDCGILFAVLQVEGGHFMIQDGERRYRGSIAAASKTILAKVVPPLTEGERLLRQLTANTGKPLTAVEEAFAFKRLMESEGWSQAELARNLGRPRSVVGDRIRLVELDPAWLAGIADGRLQVSHAAILSTFSAVPSDYQAKAAKNFFEDYRITRYLEGGGSVPIGEMPRMLYVAFRDYIKPVSKTPGYRGPTIEIKDQYSDRKSKYAADIKAWRPFFNAYEKKRRKESGPSSSRSSYVDHTPVERAMKVLKAAGIEVPARAVGKVAVKPADGEAIILHENQGWARDIDPKVLLAKIDPKTITLVQNFGGDELWSSDTAAVTAARDAYQQHVEVVTAVALKGLRADLTTRRINEHAVSGPGASNLLAAISRGNPDVKVIALALGIPAPSTDGSFASKSAEKLLSAVAAVASLNLSVPSNWKIEQKIAAVRENVAFKLPEPPKSKTQEKREARAAGKQVGDPKRARKEKEVPIPAAVDVGAMRAAVEAGVEEEELEEANA